MIEFAIIVVLLVGLLYGMVTTGLSLGAKETVTQSAADAARSGIVQSTATSAESVAQTQALGDLKWLSGTLTCASSTVNCTESSMATCSSSSVVCVNAYQAFCDSSNTTECLTVAVTYNYSKAPLVPNVPLADVFVPSSMTSTATMQMSAATSS
jgi:Flp pilus assembly protein TadG